MMAFQVGSLASLDTAAYMPNWLQKAADATLLYEHIDIMVDASLAVVGCGAKSLESAERLRVLKAALNEGATMLRTHCRTFYANRRDFRLPRADDDICYQSPQPVYRQAVRCLSVSGATVQLPPADS